MKNFTIEETNYTPSVDLDVKEGTFHIKGNSYPENTLEFYDPILISFEDFIKDTKIQKVAFNIEIYYFNSSSSRVFFEIFDLIEEYSEKIDFVINWISESSNEGILEIGEDFKEDFNKLNFNIIIKD